MPPPPLKSRWRHVLVAAAVSAGLVVLPGSTPSAHATYVKPTVVYLGIEQYQLPGTFHIWLHLPMPGSVTVTDQNGVVRCTLTSPEHWMLVDTCDFPITEVATDIAARAEWVASATTAAGVTTTRHFIVGENLPIMRVTLEWSWGGFARLVLHTHVPHKRLVVRNHLGETLCDDPVDIHSGTAPNCWFIATHPDGVFEYSAEFVAEDNTSTFAAFLIEKNSQEPPLLVDDFDLAAAPGTPVELSGITEPGALVYVHTPTNIDACSSLATADGRWVCPPLLFPEGQNEIHVVASRNGVTTYLILAVRIRVLAPEIPDELGDCTIVGTPGRDVLIGTPNGDVICGLEGDDVLRGMGGPDVLIGGPGNDRLYGGPGDDIVEGGDGRDQVNGDTGNDALLGGNGNDTVTGGLGNDTIDAGAGKDTATGGTGDDIVTGGTGKDRVTGNGGNDDLRGGSDNDVLVASAGSDRVWGGSGNDQLSGDSGNDALWGGQGDDRLDAASGNDQLYGDEGNDSLVGGSGADQVDGGADRDRCQKERDQSNVQHCE